MSNGEFIMTSNLTFNVEFTMAIFAIQRPTFYQIFPMREDSALELFVMDFPFKIILQMSYI